MKSRIHIVLVSFLLLSPIVCPAISFTAARVMEQEITSEANTPILLPTRLLLLSETTGTSTDFSPAFLNAIAKERLAREGVDAKIDRSDFLRRFRHSTEKGEWTGDCELLLAPKLLLSANIHSDRGLYEVEAQIDLLVLNLDNAVMRWRRVGGGEISLKELTKSEVNEKIALFLRKEIGEFSRQGQLNAFRKASHGSCQNQTFSLNENARLVPGPSQSTVSATKRWRLGVSVGTPAIANLNFEAWDIGGLPLTAGISGMYFGTTTRGIQLTGGWIFLHRKTEHAIGLVLDWANDTNQDPTTPILTPGGYQTGTQTPINDVLNPFLGPVYSVKWNDFRVQAGAAYRIGGTGASNIRWIIQAAYFPIALF